MGAPRGPITRGPITRGPIWAHLAELSIHDDDGGLAMLQYVGDRRRIEPCVDGVQHTARHRDALYSTFCEALRRRSGSFCTYVVRFEHLRRVVEHGSDSTTVTHA